MTEKRGSSKQRGSGDRGEDLLKALPEDHVLSTMIAEHRQIIGFLRELDNNRNQLLQMVSMSESGAIIDNFSRYAHLLIDVESHNIREENVVCLELEKRGITVIPETVRQEHILLRPQTHRLFDLVVTRAKEKEFSILQAEIDETMDRLISNFMLHIQKENEILYPLAFDTIDDPAVWEEMRVSCDEIGYCTFTFRH